MGFIGSPPYLGSRRRRGAGAFSARPPPLLALDDKEHATV